MKHVQDGLIYDSYNSIQNWNEQTYWDGNNHISYATESQWEHETLHKTLKGRYFVLWWSQRQGSTDKIIPLTKEEAASWLARNQKEMPDDLHGILKEA